MPSSLNLIGLTRAFTDISLDMPAFYGRVPCVVLWERFEDHQPKHEGGNAIPDHDP